jgi:solute carrier family 35 protein C2
MSIPGDRIYHGIRVTDWSNVSSILLTTSEVIAGAILAFSMEVTEFLVITYTSSLTLSISGIFKVKVFNSKTFM